MKYKILLVLFIITFITSIILTFEPSSEICNLEKSCDVVQQSGYSTLFGIKNSYFGISIFLFVILFIYSHIKNPTKDKKIAIDVIIIIGALFALYLLYLQHFVLHAYCKYCLIIDFSLLLALIIAILTWNVKNDKIKNSPK